MLLSPIVSVSDCWECAAQASGAPAARIGHAVPVVAVRLHLHHERPAALAAVGRREARRLAHRKHVHPVHPNAYVRVRGRARSSNACENKVGDNI